MSESPVVRKYLNKTKSELCKILHGDMNFAIMCGTDQDLIKSLNDMVVLRIDPDLIEEHKNQDGDDLLLTAIKTESAESVRLLHKYGFSMESEDIDLDQARCYRTAICSAIYNGSGAVIRALIECGATLPPRFAPPGTPEHKRNPIDWYITNVTESKILDRPAADFVMNALREKEARGSNPMAGRQADPKPPRPLSSERSKPGRYPPRTYNGTKPHRGIPPSPGQTRIDPNNRTR